MRKEKSGFSVVTARINKTKVRLSLASSGNPVKSGLPRSGIYFAELVTFLLHSAWRGDRGTELTCTVPESEKEKFLEEFKKTFEDFKDFVKKIKLEVEVR